MEPKFVQSKFFSYRDVWVGYVVMEIIAVGSNKYFWNVGLNIAKYVSKSINELS
jgi:hypothetical protein